MSMPTISNLSENGKGSARKSPSADMIHEESNNEWYQSYEMGMAFCRLTERLSSEPGTKPEKELRSLERALEKEFATFCRHKAINLIDLGTGDGHKMVLVIKALNQAGIRAVRYVPVDTNPYISRYAIFTILGSGKTTWNKEEVELVFGPFLNPDPLQGDNTDSINIETLVRLSKSHSTRSDSFVRKEVIVPMTGLQIDFFKHLPDVVCAAKSLNGNAMNVFCMLGNTLGNCLPEHQTLFLTTLYNQMESGELFLLGISLRPNAPSSCLDEIHLLEREYLPGEVFMRLSADHPQSNYRSKYDSDSFCMTYSFERPDKSIQDMGYSYLFDRHEVINDLKEAHFEVLSCESYPSCTESLTPPRSEHGPQYLTILARKS